MSGCGASGTHASALQPNTALAIIGQPVPTALWKRLTSISFGSLGKGATACASIDPTTGKVKTRVCSGVNTDGSIQLQRNARSRALLVALLRLPGVDERAVLLLYNAPTGKQCLDLETVGPHWRGASQHASCDTFAPTAPITAMSKSPGPRVLAAVCEASANGIRVDFRAGRSLSYALPAPSEQVNGRRLFMLALGSRRVSYIELLRDGRTVARVP